MCIGSAGSPLNPPPEETNPAQGERDTEGESSSTMRMRQLLLTMLLITGVATGGVLPAPATDPLRAGAGVADITPENGRNFVGYVRPDIAADGVALRLFAHAL